MKKILRSMALLLFSLTTLMAQEKRENLYFDYGEFKLKVDVKSTIDQFIQELDQAAGNYQIQLIGHTDADGDLAYNQGLSLNRSKQVKSYLLQKGFKSKQIVIEGHNYQDSIATNIHEGGKAQNRRVEMVFSWKKQKEPQNITKKKKKSPAQPVVNLGFPIEQTSFEAEEGIDFSYARSGTKIKIPANILMYEDGRAVQGAVDVEYYEMRDAADFIAAGIPMEYDGGVFNSAGMFELKVSQNGEELFVKAGAYYDIEFEKTEDLSDLGFYRYNREKNEWTVLGKLDEKSESYETQSDFPCYKPNNGFKIKTKDTIETFIKAMELGLYLSENKGMIQEYNKGRFLNLEDRWKSPHYAGTTLLEDPEMWSEGPMVIEITADLEKSKLIYTDDAKTHVKAQNHSYLAVKTMAKSFPELAVLNDDAWIYLKKGELYELEKIRKNWADGATVITMGSSHKKSLAYDEDDQRFQFYDENGYLRSQKRRWTDARLEYNGDGSFTLILKAKDVQKFKIYPEAALGKRQRQKKCEAIYSKYKKVLENRQTTFDQKVASHQKHWKDFLYYSKPFRRAYEHCMGNKRWMAYFDMNHGETMEPRYERLVKVEPHADSIAKLLNTGSLPIAAPSPSGVLSQGLRLNGFGVYNCDQVRRLGNRVEILANYKDEKGDVLDAESLYIIDYELNTAMSFDPYAFKVNSKSKTAVFIVDKRGKSFLVDAEFMSSLDLNDKQNVHELVAKDISAKIKSTNDLRDVLGLTAG